MKTAFLIVAGGRGSRFGGPLPKQYTALHGKTVLRRTIERLQALAPNALIQTVIHPDDEQLYRKSVDGLQNLLPPTHGGTERQDSVRHGLKALAPHKPDYVMIHDAARPFVDAATINRLTEALASHEGGIAGVPIVDALWRTDAGDLCEAVDRTAMWRGQTPQAFRFEAILNAHQQTKGQALADDAAVARAAGLSVAMVEGSETCFKITTADDLQKAEQHLMTQLSDTRTGTGFDVHAFEDGDAVILCGVTVPHTHKLKGHSDADVGLHALTDAILGAIGEGDIGDHFPPSDPQWKGAPSDLFLRHATKLVLGKGGIISHLDLTLICEAPKIGPHRAAMRSAVAAIVGIGEDRVSIKATTTEKLGFTGRREGIAALGTATVRLP